MEKTYIMYVKTRKDMRKTDEKILQTCSRIYRFLPAKEIAGAAGLKYVTVSQRIESINNQGFLISEPYGKGKKYRFNFDFDPARKLRLFYDSLYLYSKTHLKKYLDRLLDISRKDPNISSIIIYGSSLDTDKFNDVDVLIISDKPVELEGFDIFNLTPDSFRKLFSLGELRLQAALVNGRILLDRDFLFSYFKQDLPVPLSDEIVSALNKKIKEELSFLEQEKDFKTAKKKLLDILELKAALSFSKSRVAVPSRPNLPISIKKLDPTLYKTLEQINKINSKKHFWGFYYNIKDSI